MCAQKLKYVTFSSAFSSRYAKTRTCKVRNVVRQHTEVLYGFCWKFTWLSSSARILKIHKNSQSYRHEFNVLLFWGHSVVRRIVSDRWVLIQMHPAAVFPSTPIFTCNKNDEMETENLSTVASRFALRSATELVGDKEPRPTKPVAVVTCIT